MNNRIVQAVACVLVGIFIGWWWQHPRPPPAEGEKLARTLPKSKAEVLARDPSAPVSKPMKAAIKESGGKVERVIHLEVRPQIIPAPVQTAPPALSPPEGEAKPAAPAPGCSCAPVEIDLALVRMPDDTRRVLALGANGEEIAGVDIPFVTPAQRANPRWAAGASYSSRKEPGAWIDRAAGPFVVGVAVEKRSQGLTGVARLGIRF